MKRLKDNIIFVVIIVVILLGFFIISNEEYIRSNPFQKEFTIDTPLANYIADNGNNIIIDNGGHRLVVTDRSRNLLQTINGSYDEDNFSNATEVACDNEDNIYVIDKPVDELNQYAAGGRIIRFDASGKYLKEVLCDDSESESGVVNSLYGLKIYGDRLYVVRTKENDIEALCIDLNTDEIIEQKTYEYEDAYIKIADAAVNSRLEICFATRYGVAFRYDDQGIECIYGGKYAVSVSEISLAYEVDFTEDDSVCVNDLGLRRIVLIPKKGDKSKIIDRYETVDDDSRIDYDDVVDAPMYSNLGVFGDKISVISSDYKYDETIEDYVYQYKIYVKNLDGEVLYSDCLLESGDDYSVRAVLVKAAIVLFIIILIYSAARLMRIMRRSKSLALGKIQVITFVTALVVAVFVAVTMADNYNGRYADEMVNKMTNIVQMTCKLIDYKDIEKINKPSDYRSKHYNAVDEAVSGVLKNETNRESGLYCVIYKVFGNSVWEIYSDPYYHGGFYPMPGAYEGSGEQSLYETGETYVNNNFSNATGNYMMVISPIKDDDGRVVALTEIGIDLSEFSSQNDALLFSVIMYVIMGIIVALLLFGEVIGAREAIVQMKDDKRKAREINVMAIRPIVFVVFFASNMSTAFMPIYGESLFDASFPMPAEMAAAFPLSAEMFVATLISIFAGNLVDKYGERNISVVAMLFYIAGLGGSGFATDLYQLIAANILVGIGGGLFLIAINSYIASRDKDEERGRGFSCFNAALAAGGNCGTVVGSMIAEKTGYRLVFIVGAVLIVGAAGLVVIGMNKKRSEGTDALMQDDSNVSEENSMGILKFITTPRVLLFILMIIMPYLVCGSFLTYFFPLYGAENGLTEMQISLAFLISGVISIYAGPVLSDAAIAVLGCKRSIILGSVMYVAAIMYFVYNPGIEACFVVITLFSLADSFGLTSQDVYFSGLDEVSALGSGKAMAVKSVFENIANVFGPIVYGIVLLYGAGYGNAMICVVFCIMLVIYVVYTLFDIRKNNTEVGLRKGQADE